MNKINLEVPNEILEYILYQRTGFLKHPRSLIYRALKKLHVAPSYATMVSLEAAYRKRQIKEAFEQEMIQEYRTIKDFLPANPGHVLDIGCGIGGVDIFIDRHYNSPKNLLFHLVDKTKIEDNIYYGFHEKGAFYNSLILAKEFLSKNLISVDRIKSYEVGDDARINIQQKFDVAISLLSWGFHYPVDAYIDQVFNLMNEGGVLILDIRKNTSGEDKVREYFPKVHGSIEFAKYNRLIVGK